MILDFRRRMNEVFVLLACYTLLFELIDVSGHPVGSIFKNRLPLEDGAVKLFRNVEEILINSV